MFYPCLFWSLSIQRKSSFPYSVNGVCSCCYGGGGGGDDVDDHHKGGLWVLPKIQRVTIFVYPSV
jgi:hypothetical protein